MKKKILFLSPLPPPHYGSAISSEMCLNILKNSKNFDVRNIKLNYSKEMSDIGRINLEKVKGIFYVKKQIKNIIKEFKPNVIYFVPATSGLGLIRDYFFAKQIRKYRRGKILFHIRSRILDEDWNNYFKRRIIKKMFRREKAIVLGEELIGDLHNLIKKENLFILPNAIKNEVSEKEFKKIIKQRKKIEHSNVLFLSNMFFSKGWPKLLQACKILKNKKINFKCNFVGAFPGAKEKNFFLSFVKKNNLDKNIFYFDKKIGKEKNKIFENSDVLIFPTEYPLETFGIVILEAMMFGLPVIANGVATIPSIIEDGKTGFVLKENSPLEIAEYLEILIKDKKSREKMGNEGRKRFLENYEFNNHKKKFLDILKKEI